MQEPILILKTIRSIPPFSKGGRGGIYNIIPKAPETMENTSTSAMRSLHAHRRHVFDEGKVISLFASLGEFPALNQQH
jgi:hypothetical protein